MTNAIKRTLVTTAAVVCVATALVLSGGLTQARPLHKGINNAARTVVDCGQVVGRDPDINVRGQLLKEGCDPTGGDGGGDGGGGAE